MKSYRTIFLAAFVSIVIMSIISCDQQAATNLTPPVANVIPKTDTIHGDILVDNYFWLRNRGDSAVLNYLEAENDYTKAVMASTTELQNTLYEEMVGRLKETDLSVPVLDDGFYYYYRTEEGKQYRTLCRKQGSLEANEEILLDLNEMAVGREYLGLGVYEVSPNHELLAFSIDTTGNENYVLYFKNLTTGKTYSEAIPHTGELAWANNNHTVFYSVEDSTHRPYKLFRHEVGTNPDRDALAFHEKDAAFYLSVSKTKSEKYILVTLESQITSEIHFYEADKPVGRLTLIHPRQNGMEYNLAHHDAWFYIVTNDDARNFKLVRTPVLKPGKRHWKTVIAVSDTAKIDRVEAFENYLVVYGRINGLRQILVRDLKSGEMHVIEHPEPVFAVYGEENPDFSSQVLRYSYQSLVTPETIYDYDMASREKVLKKQKEVLGGYDPRNYESASVMATAEDGAQVPISFVYRKGMQRDGSNPLLLYGYGSYGYSMEPRFRSRRLSLLDRGFIFAIAHIRGGGEMGRHWYEDGKLLNKKNTFTDFITCADHLVRKKYTTHDKMAIEGGSAGGLLIGAVLNMRPDLAAAAIADVPFVDVINTMLDPTIPLTVIEYEEWGNPNDPEYYQYMKSYSPYDNVAAVPYPHILVEAGLNDARVQYWEPAKWTAKLRATKTGDNMLLLKTNMGAGHGGASGRYDYLREIAFEYAFILKSLGVVK